MKKSYINILLILWVVLFAQSQDFFRVGKFEAQSVFNKTVSINSSKPFDVLHYKLDANLAMEDSSFSGTMKMKILITKPTDSLTMHSVGLVFLSLKVNSNQAAYQFYPTAETFTIHLGRTFVAPETVEVDINYYRDLAFSRHPMRLGYYWFRKSPGAPNHIEENIGYTMSEPSDARLWMPCYDDPSDKVKCEINATVPQGYQAGSNGLLIGVSQNGDNTITYKWREDSPITTYLMVITASKYSKYSQYYRRVTNPSDSIEIVNYMWQMDSAGTTWNAVKAFENVPQMMEVYSTIFGEYPFAKYGHAVAYPFYYGGMEHQTLSTIHRGWLSVGAYPFYEDWIAHELVHQWWGNLVTCETWKDIWLNEGFATYSEMLWREFAYGIQSRDELLNRYTRFTDGSWKYAIYDPVGQGIKLFTGNVYQKAGWVLHMFRNVVGDSVFFKILHNYRDAHYYGTATTQDFIDAVNTTTGINYDWFFNQWIYGKGWLKLGYETAWDNDNKLLTLILHQQQELTWPTYKMPVEIKFYIRDTDTLVTVWDSLRVQSFQFAFEFRPDSLKIDPNNKILRQISTTPVSVNEEDIYGFQLFQNYPNPFNPATTIAYHITKSSYITLKVYDLLGREVETLIDGSKEAGSYLIDWNAESVTGGLPSGIYFYRMTVTDGNKTNYTQTKKLVLIK
ncbi:MAG: M1 family aminopeptidase [Bacteroidota bacterium]|nr:M1 family aminopeptidase [Bacteroidota bacterium]